MDTITSSPKDYFYYYIYRKKINPSEIKRVDDLPVPLLERTKNYENLNSRSDSLPKLNVSPENLRYNSTLSKANSDNSDEVNYNKFRLHRRNSLPDFNEKGVNLKINRNKNSNSVKKNNSQKYEKETLGNKFLPQIAQTRNQNGIPKNGPKFDISRPSVDKSFLNLKPEEGLQWSRHTTIHRGKHGSRESTVMIESRRIIKEGQPMEEITEIETESDENGFRTKSKKVKLKSTQNPNFVESSQIMTLKTPGIQKKPNIVDIPQISDLDGTKINNSDSDDTKINEIKFEQDILGATNNYRKIHNVGQLKTNNKLTEKAKHWADHLGSIEKMEHSQNITLGENIFCKTSSEANFQITGGEVVKNWYNEIKDHNYVEEPKKGFLNTGHFSQLVWKSTKELGVGVSRNEDGHMLFVVVYFYPKGNWIGEFAENVLRPKSVARDNFVKEDKKISVKKTVSEPKNFTDRVYKPIPKINSKPETILKPQIKKPNTTRTLKKLEKHKPSEKILKENIKTTEIGKKTNLRRKENFKNKLGSTLNKETISHRNKRKPITVNSKSKAVDTKFKNSNTIRKAKSKNLVSQSNTAVTNENTDSPQTENISTLNANIQPPLSNVSQVNVSEVKEDSLRELYNLYDELNINEHSTPDFQSSAYSRRVMTRSAGSIHTGSPIRSPTSYSQNLIYSQNTSYNAHDIQTHTETSTTYMESKAEQVIQMYVPEWAEDTFYQDCLNAHNYYREKHGVQPVLLTAELSKISQEWADHIASMDSREHRTYNDYGENMYSVYKPNDDFKLSGKEPVDTWYEEVDDFVFGQEPGSELEAGQFTQLVWADTRELGLGLSKSSSGIIYVVANYFPPGNYVGHFAEKVQPARENLETSSLNG